MLAARKLWINYFMATKTAVKTFTKKGIKNVFNS